MKTLTLTFAAFACLAAGCAQPCPTCCPDGKCPCPKVVEPVPDKAAPHPDGKKRPHKGDAAPDA